MFLHSTSLAIASALAAGALTVSTLAPPDRTAQTAAEEITIHAAMPAGPGRALSVYDALGHEQISPAQTYCDRHEVVTGGLNHDFAETLRAEKVSNDGLRIELWTSDLMGTWTALHHGEDGIACIVASGVDWSPVVSPEDLIQLAMQEVVYGW